MKSVWYVLFTRINHFLSVMNYLILVAMLLFVIVCSYPIAGLLAKVFSVGNGSFLHTAFGAACIAGFIVIVLAMSRFMPYAFMRVIYYVMGAVVLLLLVAVAYWVKYGLLKLLPWVDAHVLMTSWRAIAWTALVWFGLIAFSVYQFEKPHMIRQLEFVSSAVEEEVTIVYFADTQYWSTSVRNLQKVVDTINTLNPNAILFGGDWVDFDNYTVDWFSVLAWLDAPTYWITGNHEYYHNASRVRQILDGIDDMNLLDDEQVVLPWGVQVVGIDYRHATSKSSYLTQVEKFTAQTDLFSIFLFHEPKWVEETAARWKYDLQLYGHTHGGQMFPGTLVAKAVYGAYALWKSVLNWATLWTGVDTTVYTTSWAGLFGPRMRLGTVNEIVQITITPPSS